MLPTAIPAAAQGFVSARVLLPADIGAHNNISHRPFRPPQDQGRGGIGRKNLRMTIMEKIREFLFLLSFNVTFFFR